MVKNSGLISIENLSREKMLELFKKADYYSEKIKNNEPINVLENKVVGILFFQPSTRTRTSFESATVRLNGKCIGFADVKLTRGGDYYRESLYDILNVVSQYCDVMVLRHFSDEAIEIAQSIKNTPIINAGIGYREHPTQALTDLYTMYKESSLNSNLKVGLIGDINIRSFRSLIKGLNMFAVKNIYHLPAPNSCVPVDIKQFFENNNINYYEMEDAADMVGIVDVLETIGVNHPNHSLPFQNQISDLGITPNTHKITLDTLKNAKDTLKVLHPMPRTDEIDVSVDQTIHAKYFEQCKYGMLIRMALLSEFS